MTESPSEGHINEANIIDGFGPVSLYDRNEPRTDLPYHNPRDQKQKSRKFSHFGRSCCWNRLHSAHCVVTARKC
jgi:hypothetical protein